MPWSGWRWQGLSPVAFLGEPWPRYWTGLDVFANVALYIPLGILIALGFGATPRATSAAAPRLRWIVPALACSALSLALESLQTLLPERVPSRVDWIANSLGGGAGTLIAIALHRIGRRLEAAPPAWAVLLHINAHRRSVLVLVVVWLIAQMAPHQMLFATGVMLEPTAALAREYLGATDQGLGEVVAQALRMLQVDDDHAAIVEALAIAANVAAVGLLVIDASDSVRFRSVLIGGLLLAAVALNAGSARWLYTHQSSGVWLTASAQGGLLLGLALLALMMQVSRNKRLALATLFVATGLIFDNIWPTSGYSPETSAYHGALRNLHALLSALATLWPFASLFVLISQLRTSRAGKHDAPGMQQGPQGNRLTGSQTTARSPNQSERPYA
jgi:VanZ family protein